MIQTIQIHLLYASIVWIAALLLTSLNNVTATTKYWIWVATALNFILPLSLIPARFWPSQVSWFTPRFGFPVVNVARPLIVIWIVGTLLMLARLSIRARANGGDNNSPAVVGLIHTTIALPAGLDRLLSRDELDAVLAHEIRHAKRRDNLIRLVYELIVCALWFHPLVWMTGRRLALYRELSCDEAVLEGRSLISALRKLASPENDDLLRATASSFVSDRLIHLATPRRPSRFVNGLLAAVFLAVLLIAVVTPVSQSVAGYLCDLTRGLVR